MIRYLNSKINNTQNSLLEESVSEDKKKLAELDEKYKDLAEFYSEYENIANIPSNQNDCLVARDKLISLYGKISKYFTGYDEMPRVISLILARKAGIKLIISKEQEELLNKFINEVLSLRNSCENEYFSLVAKADENESLIEENQRRSARYKEVLDIYNAGSDYIPEWFLDEVLSDTRLSDKRKYTICKEILIFNRNVYEPPIENRQKMTEEELIEVLDTLYNDIKDEPGGKKKIGILLEKYTKQELEDIINSVKANKLPFLRPGYKYNFIKILLLGTSADIINSTVNDLTLGNGVLSFDAGDACKVISAWLVKKRRNLNSEKRGVNRRKSKDKKYDDSTDIVPPNPDPASQEQDVSDPYSDNQSFFEVLNYIFINYRRFFKDENYSKKIPLSGLAKVLNTSLSVVKRNELEAKLYGLPDDKINPTVLSTSKVMDTFDFYIEQGLKDSIFEHPSRVSYSPLMCMRIKYCLENGIEFYDGIAISDRTVVEKTKGINYEESLKLHNFDDEESKEFNEYLDNNYPIPASLDKEGNISGELMDDNFIVYLEENYKRSNYEYLINGILVSRLKVLRILNTLFKNNEFDKEKAYRYAVFYNMMLTEDEYTKLNDGINTIIDKISMGGNNGSFRITRNNN